MNFLWDQFWPAVTAAVVFGVISGAFAFRRRRSLKRTLLLAAGVAATLLAGFAWVGPAGAGERFAAAVDREARQVLVNYEVTQFQARTQRAPVARTVLLSGPADDFQRGELVRIMKVVPGVANARWDGRKSGLPLVAEVELVALLSFGLGLVLAYLLELRRRSRAQWSW